MLRSKYLTQVILVSFAAMLLASAQSYAQNEENESAKEDVSEPKPAPVEKTEEKASEAVADVVEATPSVAGMPTVIRQSKTDNTVYQGDRLVLGVQAKGSELLYRWIRNYKTICTTAECEFDSGKWGVGSQNLTVVIYNRLGSQTINFRVRILNRELDKKSATVKSEMVAPTNVETVSSTDYYIKAISGIGYSFRERTDVKIVAELPLVSSWTENVKAHTKGVVQVGVKAKEEHILLPSGAVVLSRGAYNRRLISLSEGSLRSRQLFEEHPAWSIIVGEWLQIDADTKGDIIVEREAKKDRVFITVLRGSARALIYDAKDLTKATSIYFAQGDRYEVTPKSTEAVKVGLNIKTFESIVRKSTPQYFLKAKGNGKISSFIQPDVAANAKRPIAELLKSAEKDVADADGFRALESLLPAYAANKQNFAVNLTIGQAYSQVGLFREAFRYFKDAGKLDPKSPLPPYEIGMAYLRSGNWGRAEAYLSQALERGYPDEQEVLYQLGVSAFNRGETYTSRNYFRKASKVGGDELLHASTMQYLGGINDDRWWGAVGFLRFGQDSNVFRWGSGTRTDAYKTESSMYYEAGFDAYFRGYEKVDGSLVFGFNLDKIFYADSKANKVGPLYQSLYLNWLYNFGATATEKPWMQLGIEPYVKLIGLGEERSMDIFGIAMKVGAPRQEIAPYLKLVYDNASDPLPARDDLVDPILLEPVLPSDRSTKITSIGVGFDFIKEPPRLLNLEILRTKSEHKNGLIKVDDYTELSLDLTGKMPLSDSIAMDGAFGYLSRNFTSSTDGRKDNRMQAKAASTYYFNPVFNTDLSLLYTKQSSTRAISTYNRYDIVFGLNLEL